MKFTGLEHVELRLPRTLDDLRAYTSMSLLLQRPEGESRGDGRRRRRQGNQDNGDLFILYLGNKDVSELCLVWTIACSPDLVRDTGVTRIYLSFWNLFGIVITV